MPGTPRARKATPSKVATNESTEVKPEVAKAAPANKVDETVINQESLGSGKVIDRSPEPQIVETSSGASYDVSKSSPELIDPDKEETEARRARLRQTDAALNAKDLVEQDDDRKKVELEFVETGLTAQGRVWKRGEILSFEETEETRKANTDNNDDVWYELSADKQKERYGKVFFEKR